MGENQRAGPFDPGDPYGLRLLRRTLFWLAGILGFWATFRVLMLGRNYETYFVVALVLLLVGGFVEPVVDRLRRRREPF